MATTSKVSKSSPFVFVQMDTSDDMIGKADIIVNKPHFMTNQYLDPVDNPNVEPNVATSTKEFNVDKHESNPSLNSTDIVSVDKSI